MKQDLHCQLVKMIDDVTLGDRTLVLSLLLFQLATIPGSSRFCVLHTYTVVHCFLILAFGHSHNRKLTWYERFVWQHNSVLDAEMADSVLDAETADSVLDVEIADSVVVY